jgi:hypothetical protein
MILRYDKVYTSDVGRKFHKNLTKKFASKEEMLKWLECHNVKVKDVIV